MVALIALERVVPVRADTKVALAFQGLTGLAEVSLTGGSADAAAAHRRCRRPADALCRPRSAAADVTQAARDVLSRIDGMVAENETALRISLHNIETVTTTLAENSQRLDKVMAGLESLTGGTDGNAARSARPPIRSASLPTTSTSGPTRSPPA